MRRAFVACLVLAVAGVLAALVSTQLERGPDCWDPPCGGAKSLLAIYGTLGAMAFGGLALLLGVLRVLRGPR